MEQAMPSNPPSPPRYPSEVIPTIDEWELRRNRTKYILFAQFIVLGMEFTITQPVMVFYLEQLKAPNIPYFLGAVSATYCMASMIFSVVLGRISDVKLSFRWVILSINITNIIGNIIYVIGYSSYLLLASRFLCGSFDAITAVSHGEYGRIYTSKEMMSETGFLMIGHCIGMCLGPIFSLVPNYEFLNLGYFSFNNNNVPGIIMIIMHIAMFVISFFGIVNLTQEQARLCQQVPLMNQAIADNATMLNTTDTCRKLHINEELVELKELCEDGDVRVITMVPSNMQRAWWKLCLEFSTRKDMGILLFGQAVWAYASTSTDTMLALTAIEILDFSPQLLAVSYLSAGLLFTLILASSSKLLKRFTSTTVCISGFLMFFVCGGGLFLCYLSRKYNKWISVAFFGVFVLGSYSGWCYNSIGLKAILSDHVCFEEQSFSQGIFGVVEYLVSVSAGATTGLAYNFYVSYCGWTMITNVMVAILFSVYYKVLNKKCKGSVMNK